MFIQNWKKQIFTIPNYLSMMRLVLIPVYTAIYLKARRPSHFFLAGGVLIISCMTDILDGKIARQFHLTTTLGKILDPIADKLTQLTIILCLALHYPVLFPLLGLFITKELFQLAMGVIFLLRGKMLSGALISGKICTTILFVSFILLVLLPSIPTPIVNSFVLIDAIFLSISFVCYVLAYFGKNAKIMDINMN